MLIVRGAVKDYDWGIVDGLAPWSERTGGPQAELWFGVHPGGPSPLIGTDWELTGEHLGDRFDVEAIPLLVKLLAAAKPLSVQVHPKRAVAEVQYARQQHGAERIYSDPFEKTEMLIALEPFEAFVGWRAKEQALAILESIDGTSQARAAWDAGRMDEAIRALIEASTPERIASLPMAVDRAGLTGDERAAYQLVSDLYPEDAGALITPLLAYLALNEGEAVFVPAGLPHSYIRGIGLEVMSSSDNVVRLGLTTKTVAIDHALAALDRTLSPQIMRTTHGDLIWPIDSPFVVRVLRSGDERILSGSYRIVLLIEGSAVVETDGAEATLKQGTAAVLGSKDPTAMIHADGMVAIIQSTER